MFLVTLDPGITEYTLLSVQFTVSDGINRYIKDIHLSFDYL